jgi:CHASE1-domain containing sensor protein
MHKSHYILRIVAVLLILVLSLMAVKISRVDTRQRPLQPISRSTEEYQLNLSRKTSEVPTFTYGLEALFPREPVPVQESTSKRSTAKPKRDVNIPNLQFVGMIETEKGKYFSFRNMHTNKLLLLQQGVRNQGLTLLSREKSVFRMEKEGSEFQVEQQ